MVLTLIVVIGLSVNAPSRIPTQQTSSLPSTLGRRFGDLPLSFAINAGQSDALVRFQTHSLGGALYFTATELVLSLPTAVYEPRLTLADKRSAPPPTVVQQQFEGANPGVAIS